MGQTHAHDNVEPDVRGMFVQRYPFRVEQWATLVWSADEAKQSNKSSKVHNTITPGPTSAQLLNDQIDTADARRATNWGGKSYSSPV